MTRLLKFESGTSSGISCCIGCRLTPPYRCGRSWHRAARGASSASRRGQVQQHDGRCQGAGASTGGAVTATLCTLTLRPPAESVTVKLTVYVPACP